MMFFTVWMKRLRALGTCNVHPRLGYLHLQVLLEAVVAAAMVAGLHNGEQFRGQVGKTQGTLHVTIFTSLRKTSCKEIY